MHNDKETDTKPRTHCLSILLIVFVLAIVVEPIAANAQTRSFMTVNCDNISLIEGEMLFLRSAHGFIHNGSSGSRLQEAVPQEVYGGGISGEQSVQTIVIQQIPTKYLGFKRLEGGIPGTILFVIAGGVIGALAAPMFRKNPAGFALGGLLVGYLTQFLLHTEFVIPKFPVQLVSRFLI